MASRLFRLYSSNFERRPMRTLVVANGFLSVTGDACAQLLPLAMGVVDPTGMTWDFARTGRFLAFGAAMAPFMGKWNHFIEHAFPLRLPSKSSAGPKSNQAREARWVPSPIQDPLGAPALSKLEDAVPKPDPPPAAGPSKEPPVSLIQLGKRLGTDQLVMGPVGLAAFILFMGLMEGLDWEHIRHRFQSMYLAVLLINWQVWPIVQVINFRFVPLPYRIPFSASCGILWTVFISYRTALEKKEEKEEIGE